MKTFTKIIATTAAVFICMGLILGTVGLAMGASVGDAWSGRYGTNSIHESYTGVTSLDFELGFGEVKFVEGDKFAIDAETGFKIRSWVEYGTWKIETKENWWKNNWGINIGSGEKGDIVITLPKGFEAKDLNLELGMGTLKGDILRGNNIDIDVGMGTMKLDGVYGRDVDIKCGMGTLDIGLLDADEIYVDCGMGKVDAVLAGAEKDYEYTADVGMGRVQVGSSSLNGFGRREKQNSGAPLYLDVECGMGKIHIEFENE